MFIRYGYRIEFDVFQPMTILTALDLSAERQTDVIDEDWRMGGSGLSCQIFKDAFGNTRRRIEAAPGTVSLESVGTIYDTGYTDPWAPSARQVPAGELPTEVLPFLLGSRYCETDLLGSEAWMRFGHIEGGWARVQAVCDFVHSHLTFGYGFARPTRTAAEAYQERVGVCRDFTHLAVTLCRALNIPARYCNGYLGDIGVPFNPSPMDFNAWFEAYIGDQWYLFDARHNMPRIGRITVARGRDAADIPMLHSFGPHNLRRFEVMTEEVADPALRIAAE
ncbi:Transglutaminase-like enzyme, putative cysteine protease [Kaistia soli DSM 19436]|uniref:Transglutaminase-like enzyme, putative cysteine protease n=1 Tax=Kaistia soli DSM 19436 TaxID=1122133 RepID=A0A1M5J0A0_9HYPH|nr:transglutaminase family protein [Kaistia soli]SHG33729.1 Transglutaminase-like enzyme, putative cysteine protease [Kaistia soli DSM 19436]